MLFKIVILKTKLPKNQLKKNNFILHLRLMKNNNFILHFFF